MECWHGMLPGYSFEPRPNIPNRRALVAICRELYLFFARCNMSSAGCSTPERKSVCEPTKTLGSPQTPVKLGIRKRKDEKYLTNNIDKSCNPWNIPIILRISSRITGARLRADLAAILIFHGRAGSIITIGFFTKRMLALEKPV